MTSRAAPADDDEIRVTACTTCPGRTLIAEEGNTDGWLSSDLVVDVEEHR
ncbi:hypothetical protein [Halomarina litorea]|nr:hypothetical protein [Halomarina sp. BCD28]